MKLICRDIPKHRLFLFDPSDPSCEKLTTSFTDKWKATSEVFQFRCLALLNESNQEIVAYRLLWNLEQANGTQTVDEKSFASVDGLMGFEPGPESVNGFANFTIKPGNFRLFSMATHMPLDIRAKAGISRGINAFTGGGDLSQVEQGAVHVRAIVSIDGAFYSDGRFVGPDTSGYFDFISSQIKAKWDLLQEISRHSESGRPLADLFEALNSEVRQGPYEPHMTRREVYKFYRQIFIQEVLGVRSACGDVEAVNLSLRGLKRHWPALRRIRN
jgi:hypothetical protein